MSYVINSISWQAPLTFEDLWDADDLVGKWFIDAEGGILVQILDDSLYVLDVFAAQFTEDAADISEYTFESAEDATAWFGDLEFTPTTVDIEFVAVCEGCPAASE